MNYLSSGEGFLPSTVSSLEVLLVGVALKGGFPITIATLMLSWCLIHVDLVPFPVQQIFSPMFSNQNSQPTLALLTNIQRKNDSHGSPKKNGDRVHTFF